jgi:hypothetical protein
MVAAWTITGADPDKAGTNPISNDAVVDGFNGLNSLFNDLTTIPLGKVLLIHISGMVLLVGAVSLWAVLAWRNEATYRHDAAGNGALGHVGICAVLLCGVTLAFALAPVTSITLLSPVGRALGLGHVN